MHQKPGIAIFFLLLFFSAHPLLAQESIQVQRESIQTKEDAFRLEAGMIQKRFTEKTLSTTNSEVAEYRYLALNLNPPQLRKALLKLSNHSNWSFLLDPSTDLALGFLPTQLRYQAGSSTAVQDPNAKITLTDFASPTIGLGNGLIYNEEYWLKINALGIRPFVHLSDPYLKRNFNGTQFTILDAKMSGKMSEKSALDFEAGIHFLCGQDQVGNGPEKSRCIFHLAGLLGVRSKIGAGFDVGVHGGFEFYGTKMPTGEENYDSSAGYYRARIGGQLSIGKELGLSDSLNFFVQGAGGIHSESINVGNDVDPRSGCSADFVKTESTTISTGVALGIREKTVPVQRTAARAAY